MVRGGGLRRPSCRSMRDLLLTTMLVASLSVIITYQLSKYLPTRPSTELKILFNGRLDLLRELEYMQDEPSRYEDQLADIRQGLEGIDLEVERRNQRRPVSPNLLRHLHELEQKQIGSSQLADSSVRVAVVKGQSAVLDRDLPSYQQALQKAGFTIKVPAWYHPGQAKETVQDLEGAESSLHFPLRTINSVGEWQGWSLLLCLAVNDGDAGICLDRQDYSQLLPQQKVSRIPGIRSTLWRKDNFCHTMNAAKHIPALRQSPLAPPCFVLPEQLEDYLSVADMHASSAKWVFKTLGTDGMVQLLQPTNDRDFLRVKGLAGKHVLVQQYFSSPLLLYGMPFSVRLFVLVTSASPLRAYLHTDGIVQFRNEYQRNFSKIRGRTWTLSQLHQYVIQTHGQKAADIAFRNMESVIVQTLLVSESSLTAHFSSFADSFRNPYRCENCFQLLEFEVIFNSSFHPIVTEVNGQPDLADTVRVGSWASGAAASPVIDDLLSVVSATTSVAGDVARALAQLNTDVRIEPQLCDRGKGPLCLTSQDVHYLLAMRREQLHRGRFQMLYPSKSSSVYSSLVEDLYHFSQRSSDNTHHGTPHLHSLVASLARFYAAADASSQDYDDVNVPLFPENHHLTEKYTHHPCIQDKSVMPYLEGIYTEPSLNITPMFDPLVEEYYATVPYNVYLVNVWGKAQSCYSEARLEEKYGLSRPSNYTLGLGSNKINVVVVDVTHTEPWILNTYSLTVYRQAPGEPVSPKLDRSAQACMLQQDCSLPYLPGQPCGLQRSSHPTWGNYITHRQSLPACDNGHQPGSWMVPCASCNNSESCMWKDVQWQPNSCVHPRMPREKLKQCLAGKQILFIGDSTNRGMMHYLMEAANDSLTEWDKTHDTKVYTNVNNDQTTVSFTYYPQFWLPAAERPVFDKALYQLMKPSMPLENSDNTVVVVGGVHWLATHHLTVLLRALQKEGLSNVHVVVKTLGSGFHQPVDGLHCLTLREQRKLAIHNQGLVEFAERFQLSVVDTFNMTMARYTDFLQGKCACHFHRIKEMLPSFTEYMRSTGMKTTGGSKLVDMPIHYHVEGEINAVYSEILLNRICHYRGEV